MQETHGNRFNRRRGQLLKNGFQVGGGERNEDRAVRGDTFPHAEPEFARYQGNGFLPIQIVRHRNADAPQFEHVAKSLGRQQRNARALAFQYGVGGYRRGVDDFRDLAHRHGLFRAKRLHAANDRFGVVGGRRG